MISSTKHERGKFSWICKIRSVRWIMKLGVIKQIAIETAAKVQQKHHLMDLLRGEKSRIPTLIHSLLSNCRWRLKQFHYLVLKFKLNENFSSGKSVSRMSVNCSQRQNFCSNSTVWNGNNFQVIRAKSVKVSGIRRQYKSKQTKKVWPKKSNQNRRSHPLTSRANIFDVQKSAQTTDSLYCVQSIRTVGRPLALFHFFWPMKCFQFRY